MPRRSRASTSLTTKSFLEIATVLGFLLSSFHSSNAQFGVVDRRALLQGAARDDGDLSRRRFVQDTSPAWPALGLGSDARHNKRQDQAPVQCGMQKHSCLDVGPLGADLCCANNQYCFVMSNWTLGCCRMGNDCANAGPCKEDFFLTNTTSKVTVVITQVNTVGPSDDPTTSTKIDQLITASVSPGCGSRPCGRSSFLCQGQFGGQCCGYGSVCGSGSLCIADVTASVPPVVNTKPAECDATTLFACIPGNRTAGCCKHGQTCVGNDFCSGQPALPTGIDGTLETPPSELSSHAKAGIGAGVAVGAAVVIGLLTWFCVRRRREARAASRRQSTATGSHLPPPNHTTRHHGGGGGAASGTISPDLYPGSRQERAMSDVSGPTSGGMSGGRPPLHQSGLVYDYFGPDAVHGPYTEDAGAPYPEGVVPGRTLSRGVPPVPRGPSDISTPVEIGESSSPAAVAAAAGSPRKTSSLGLGVATDEAHSYTTTPDGVEGHYPVPTTTHQQLRNTTDHHTVSTSVASRDISTTNAGTSSSPYPPAQSYDPHHVQIHEMDPQREGPFELPGLHHIHGPAAAVGGPLRSYEDEEAAQHATGPSQGRDGRI
ncbi:axial budding pattern protein 2 [Microdochium nivale]|nr:axial budding pattern protein 2 [Microdochium nivale]